MNSRLHLIAFFLLIALSSLAYVFLVSPDNPLTAHFRGKITDSGGKVITGPYPLESDFKILKEYGITSIVSLLDPNLPYEKKLLDQEAILAKENGFVFVSQPLTSILGQRMGDYEARSNEAADAVMKQPGRVYLHCYLGLHRVKSVQTLIQKRGGQVGSYLIRQDGAGGDKATFERARAEFANGNYKMVVEILSPLTEAEPEIKILEAWARYRLNDLDNGCPLFQRAIAALPASNEAKLGGGYCALRGGALADAEKNFSAVLETAPQDMQALIGMGYVRYRQGRKPECADYMVKALELDPKQEEARDILAKVAPGRVPPQ